MLKSLVKIGVSYALLIGLLALFPLIQTGQPLLTMVLQRTFIFVPLLVYNFLFLKQKTSWPIDREAIKGKDLMIPYLLFGVVLIYLLFKDINEDIQYIVLSAATTAIWEEYYFRGMVLGELVQHNPRDSEHVTFSLVLGSLIFGMTHLMNLRFQAPSVTMEQVIQTTFFGLILGGLYLRSASLWFPIILHFLLNFIAGFGDSHIALDVVPTWAAIGVALVYVLLAYVICHPKDFSYFLLLGKGQKERVRSKNH